MALLRFILLIIVILLVLQLIGRIFFGYFIRRYFNSSNHQTFDDNRKEGDIHINLRKDSKKKFIQKDEGEYVKYEEIRDDD